MNEGYIRIMIAKAILFILVLSKTRSLEATICPANDDMIRDLKGFDLNYTYPCMYSGFVEVEHETDSNLFYWFFRHENGDRQAPLVFWINGGPGSSSMLGNFLENGPLRLIQDEQTGNITVHSVKGQAWSAIANLVFVDQPIGVGFSYGHRNITEGKQIGEYIVQFFKGFYQKFPDMKQNALYISGESYGGKYLPGIASAIIDYNKNASETERILLKGVLIGNGYVDPITQRLSIRQLSLGIGYAQFDSLPEVDTIERRCQMANGKKDPNTSELWDDAADYMIKLDGGMNSYDSRYPMSNSTYGKEVLIKYLNEPEVIYQIHAGNAHKEGNFSTSNSTVYQNFIGDQMVRYIDEHQKILDNNITLWIFVGQFDNRDGPYGVQQWMKKLKWAEMPNFHASSRNLYYYVSDDNNEVRLGGNFKQHKNLSLLIVYAAGHLVPATQLALSRNMLGDIITKNALQCHKADGKCSLDERVCAAMNNCTGHGDCVQGRCMCGAGYFGADCSITVEQADSRSFSLPATTWKYFQWAGEDRAKLEVISASPVQVYTRRGDVPSQSFYNSLSQGTNVVVYVDKAVSGEYVAIFNPDFDNPVNVKLKSQEKSSSSSLPVTFWICIGIAAILTISTVINIVYCLSKPKHKSKSKPQKEKQPSKMINKTFVSDDTVDSK